MSTNSSLTPLMQAVAHNSAAEVSHALPDSTASEQARALDAAVAFRRVKALEALLPHVSVEDQPQLWPHAIDKGWADVVQRLAPYVDLYANSCENLILALNSGQPEVVAAAMTDVDSSRLHESVVRTAALRGQLEVARAGWACVPLDQHAAMVMLAARSASPAMLEFILARVAPEAIVAAGDTLSRDAFVDHLDTLGEQAPVELAQGWLNCRDDPANDLPRTAARLRALDRHTAADPSRPPRVRSRARS